ncbi:MAG TPA: beta-propeller fold lactonase family protein [Candidatus Avipropionibacterium avicola]|uniref:Beta-propeller fold lactonase family protein n=1 Tax=Candidatus Avipropionibacterium avicola TaxID=2840701 RepID=A0A9D1GYR3_9ACTN|nr:beta-propeller fold lactonase family protein [Candidatus Avipropionibacterium avicola]
MDSSVSANPLSASRLVVGAYTSEMDGTAVGLSSYQLSSDDPSGLVARPVVEMASPSWVVAHPSQDTVYAIGEQDPAQVHAIGIGEDATLTPLNASALSDGAACHLAITEDARHLVVAHYGKGSVASFAINPDRTVGEQIDSYTFHNWTGPDWARQAGPHAHQVVMDGDGFWIPNLGGDVVHRLSLDGDGRFVSLVAPVELPAGSGPRHLVLVGDLMVVACELSAELWVGQRDGDTYRQVALVPSTYRDRRAEPRIYPSGIGARTTERGTEVLVANRGCDTVAAFDLDLTTGEPTLRQEFATTGWPRDLKVHGDRLWIAGQTGDRIATYVADPTSGEWKPDFAFDAATPACILLLR